MKRCGRLDASIAYELLSARIVVDCWLFAIGSHDPDRIGAVPIKEEVFDGREI